VNSGERLGQALRRGRGARSLQEVSGPARISTAYLHKLEAGGVRNPSPRVLERLAETLELPYWELMELAGYVPAGQPGPPRRRRKEQSVGKPGRDDAPTNARIVALLAEIAERLARLEEKQDALSRRLGPAGPRG
jgi:transcriptional regulator with XRE-family HTH domain